MLNNTKKLKAGKAVYLSRRLPAIYVERAKCVKKADTLSLIYALENEPKTIVEQIPVAAQSIIIFGPGCSISSEAIKLMTRSDCVAAFTGEGGMPVFAYSVSYRNPRHKILQYKHSTDKVERVQLAKQFFAKRKEIVTNLKELNLPEFSGFECADNITTMNALEGAWARKAYISLSKKYGIPYENKEKTYAAIALTNHFVYSLAHVAIVARGLDPNLGIIHGQTRGGGLVFDLADIWKPALSLKTALLGTANNWEPEKIKHEVLIEAAKTNTLENMCDFLAEVFS